MPVRVADNFVVGGAEKIPTTTFPDLVEGHLNRYPRTPSLEQEATILKSEDSNEEKLGRFIRHVCAWGRIPNPMNRGFGKWYVADVEMALFAYLNNWQGQTTG